MDKIKAMFALLVLCMGVLSFFGSFILFFDGVHNVSVINKKYYPSLLNVSKYESSSSSEPTLNSVIGKINGEEKFLLVEGSVIENRSPKSFLVFSAKGTAKLYHRKENETELDKTPFKKRAAFCFIFPIIINPLLYFLWKILTKNLE